MFFYLGLEVLVNDLSRRSSRSKSKFESLFSKCKSCLIEKESDLYKSISETGCFVNQKCFLASEADNLSPLFFNSLLTKSLADLSYLFQIYGSNVTYPFTIF